MIYRQKTYCGCGDYAEDAEDAACEAILREIDGVQVPKIRYSCIKPDSHQEFQNFRNKNKWKNAEKLHAEKQPLHYTWETASSSWYSLVIKQPPFKKTALGEVHFINISSKSLLVFLVLQKPVVSVL